MSKRIQNKISEIWNKLRKNEISRLKIFEELEEINQEIKTHPHQSLNAPQLYKLSQSVIDLYEITSISEGMDEELKVTGIILRNQLKKPVYYILNKEAIRIYAINLNWFFSTYNKTEKITENKDYVLVKEERMTSLAFTANIILNEDHKPIHEKYEDEESARNFYRLISKE